MPPGTGEPALPPVAIADDDDQREPRSESETRTRASRGGAGDAAQVRPP